MNQDILSELSNFHFLRPWWLAAGAVAIAAWWWSRRADDPTWAWRSSFDQELLAAVTSDHDDSQSRFHGVGRLVGWLAVAIALAGPTWRVQPSPFADDPVAVMVLMKSDESMNRSDFSPSRMERARLKVADFSAARPGLPLGLIAFSGSAHLVLPPTRDTAVVATMAAELSPDIMPAAGNDLPAAVRLAKKTLGDDGGVILVIDDEAIDDASNGRLERDRRFPILFHAIARPETPEAASIDKLATALRADVTMITADSSDIDSLVRQVGRMGTLVAVGGEDTQWAESGWWLVPIAVAVSLWSFRREVTTVDSATQEPQS